MVLLPAACRPSGARRCRRLSLKPPQLGRQPPRPRPRVKMLCNRLLSGGRGPRPRGAVAACWAGTVVLWGGSMGGAKAGWPIQSRARAMGVGAVTNCATACLKVHSALCRRRFLIHVSQPAAWGSLHRVLHWAASRPRPCKTQPFFNRLHNSVSWHHAGRSQRAPAGLRPPRPANPSAPPWRPLHPRQADHRWASMR